MAKQVIKLGSNPQKTVFVMLAAILLLEFGSLTKMQKIWQLAFSSAPAAGAQQTNTQGTTGQTVTLAQPGHPAQTVTL